MRRKELKSRKKMHKYKRLIKDANYSWKKESIFKEYTPEVYDFEIIRNPKEDYKRKRNEGKKYVGKE